MIHRILSFTKSRWLRPWIQPAAASSSSESVIIISDDDDEHNDDDTKFVYSPISPVEPSTDAVGNNMIQPTAGCSASDVTYDGDADEPPMAKKLKSNGDDKLRRDLWIVRKSLEDIRSQLERVTMPMLMIQRTMIRPWPRS